nr:hypothetical protein [Tanacetum cinerariifolium]
MVEHDDEIKVLGEVNVELEFGSKKLREKLSQEEDTGEEALKEFNSTLANGLEKLSQEKDIAYDFYGFMYDTDDDASISGKLYEHFGWDWPEKDLPEVVEEVIEMDNDQAEALSSDREVTDECLDDEHVEKRRPSKRIRVNQEEMAKDKKLKKGL